jgi:hypothetical protein
MAIQATRNCVCGSRRLRQANSNANGTRAGKIRNQKWTESANAFTSLACIV